MSAHTLGPALLTAVLIGLVGAPASADPTGDPAGSATVTSAPFSTPNTDGCPNRYAPPQAIDVSEVPAPGQPNPTTLTVPPTPIGGERLGDCGVATPAGAPPLPADISANGWVLSDLDSGRVLAAKDPHGRYRPASTIKVLLAIVALRELDLDKVVVGSTGDSDVEGTRVGIGPGGRYSNRQLMQALVMASGNDAAHAIAAQLGGDSAAVAKMNAVAKSLGARDTRAATPSGLDGPGMSTSAYDLSLFFREAMAIPLFAQLVHTEQVEFPGFPPDPRIPDDTDHPPFPIANDNQLLYNYEGALGGKTGFTDDARHTYVAGAERDGRRLAVTLLAADVLPIRPWAQAARLLDYGFALDRDATVGTLVRPHDPGAGTPDTDTTATRDRSGAVPLAAPPHALNPSRSDSDSDGSAPALGWRVVVVLVGSVVVVGLSMAARKVGTNR